ncbi:cold-regulated protein 27-like isoform X2 [Mangifera indica]|uniref:cold-regulated protein 27-like isoform X2 n=1 Tax=Mangifera indica TaxID=29780 RepID=UPI001CF99FF9|nr:cold-regulated protein 27-like isoform X2 [Mangifera indica]
MEDGCRSELTRSNSDSSDITVESSYQYPSKILGQSAEWTNEKHDAYLGYLEASFVQQLHELHCSTGLQGQRSQEKTRGPYISQAISAHRRFTPHQLMVLPDGSWQKIKLTGKESMFESTADSHGTLESPWIHRFTSVGQLQTATTFDPQDRSVLCEEGFFLRKNVTFSVESAGSSGQHEDYHLCHQNSAGSTTELSDQNFIDENRGQSTSCGPVTKRLKTAAFHDKKDDQVFGRTSSEREEQKHHELLLESSERFICPRSSTYSLLRGS